ncbi:MAG: MFS transporter [Pirellulales bacterium]|nr:MFS transporter [Pirellulales bacterium]
MTFALASSAKSAPPERGVMLAPCAAASATAPGITRNSFKTGDEPASGATASSSSSAVSNLALPGKPAVAPKSGFETASTDSLSIPHPFEEHVEDGSRALDSGDPADRRRGTLRPCLRTMHVEGVMCSFMQGLGELYLGAYGLAMGMGQVASGLLSTLPLLAGALLQLASPRAVSWLRSHRRWVVLCVAVQASCFLPLALGSVTSTMPELWIFVVVAVYWGTGLASGPAWSTWAASIVPVRLRPRFFGLRTRLSQAALLLGFLTSGVTLQVAAAAGCVREAFLALFSLAAVCRFASGGLLASQPEEAGRADRTQVVPWREILRRAVQSGEGRLLVYLVMMQGAVQLSGPYFTPFMLKQMRLSYGLYVLLVGTTYVAKLLAAPWWARLAQRYGAQRLLWIGGAGIVPVAGLWLVSQSFAYLMCVQIVSGVCWAAYELAMLLLLFDSLPEEERISVLTLHNLAASMATAAGSLLGGFFLLVLGQNYEAYLALFGLSSAARAAMLLVMMRLPASAARGATQSNTATWISPVRVLRIDLPAARLPSPHSDGQSRVRLADLDEETLVAVDRRPPVRTLAEPLPSFDARHRLSA